MALETKDLFGQAWDGKKKAVTFSFDDAVRQDIRLIEDRKSVV